MKSVFILISIIALVGVNRGEECFHVSSCNHETCSGSHLACHNHRCTCDPNTNSTHNICATMQDCDSIGLCLKPGTRLTCIDGQCNCV